MLGGEVGPRLFECLFAQASALVLLPFWEVKIGLPTPTTLRRPQRQQPSHDSDRIKKCPGGLAKEPVLAWTPLRAMSGGAVFVEGRAS
jgi:hypothetical protein